MVEGRVWEEFERFLTRRVAMISDIGTLSRLRMRVVLLEPEWRNRLGSPRGIDLDSVERFLGDEVRRIYRQWCDDGHPVCRHSHTTNGYPPYHDPEITFRRTTDKSVVLQWPEARNEILPFVQEVRRAFIPS